MIAHFLWRIGRRAVGGTQPAGEVFGYYLIMTGVARFLVEFIRINPRSFFGMSNAQAASGVSVIAGVMLAGFAGRTRSCRAQTRRPKQPGRKRSRTKALAPAGALNRDGKMGKGWHTWLGLPG